MTETTPTPTSSPGSRPEGRCPRWLRIALGLSLALNLLVLGLVGGSLAAYRKSGMRPPGDMAIGAYTEALSRDDRRALRRAFLAERATFEARRDQFEDDAEDLLDALRADAWDEAAVAAIFARQQARASEGLDAGQALLLERFRGMDPAARRAYADRLEQILRGMHGEGRHGRDHDDRDDD